MLSGSRDEIDCAGCTEAFGVSLTWSVGSKLNIPQTQLTDDLVEHKLGGNRASTRVLQNVSWV